jgi:hypothetical protein
MNSRLPRLPMRASDRVAAAPWPTIAPPRTYLQTTSSTRRKSTTTFRTCARELHETAVQSFGFSRTLSPESLEVFSYAGSTNANVRTLLIDAIFGVPGARNLAVRADIADALDRVMTAVLSVQRRMSADDCRCARKSINDQGAQN